MSSEQKSEIDMDLNEDAKVEMSGKISEELLPIALAGINYSDIAQQMDLRRFQPSGSAGVFNEDDVDEEVVTQCAPPTEIVDTVVTMTTNPDGSLKRTTRRTTRTLVTTTRVRRIKTKSPSSVEQTQHVSDTNTELTQTHPDTPTVYTLIGPQAECQDEHGDSRITQAAFSFMAPTTKTEVTVEENEQDVERIDSVLIPTDDAFQTGNEKDGKKGQTKKTVRKTMTSSAATATFVSTGVKKKDKGGDNTSSKHPDEPIDKHREHDTQTTDEHHSKSSSNSKVMNHLAAKSCFEKSLFFTRSSLESLRKPFSLWGKDSRSETADSNYKTEQAKELEPEDTEQLALRAMKESERLFSEAKLFLPSNALSLSPDDKGANQVIVCPTGSDHNELIRFQSRFANLPLYQGYGLIAQQFGKTNQPEVTSEDMSQTITEKSVKVTFPELSSDWFKQKAQFDTFPFGFGFEMNAATNALVSMLDETTDRMLKEAANRLYESIGQPQSYQPEIATIIPRPIEGPPSTRLEAEQLERGKLSEFHPADDSSSQKEASQHSVTEGKFPDENVCPTPERGDQPHWRKLSRLGVPSTTGAFRVAWSEMNEVVNSNALKLLTRHEIQLQEAMFEVITSEASYYQSLNVLVSHFYHAPEFSCNASCRQPDNTTNTAAFSSPPTTTDVLSNDSDVPMVTTTRRSLLKPIEKHHLFSNVLLVCLASEKFLLDLETRWTSQMPIIHEVCDLIVKHAGGVTFEPYVTYLRNQAYQMETLRKLCQRESFRTALDNLHANPISGKNSISSFLALPMQRLTRLKLLVEVIRRLQDAVIQDAAEGEQEKMPYRVPTDRERENVQIALRELSRLLASSETEKELMDRKARLLTLSNLLEFPDHVKCVAISDKRLIKEGELREVAGNGRLSMLQKLSLRKPQSLYFILFNDLLLVTKKKKNDRFLVLDYCERAEIHAELHPIGSSTVSNILASSGTRNTDSIHSEILKRSDFSNHPERPKSEINRFHTISSSGTNRKSDFAQCSPERKHRIHLGRSGSSVSNFQLSASIEKLKSSSQAFQQIEPVRMECIRLVLNTSQSGSPTELHLLPKNLEDFTSWCKALAINPTLSLLQSSLAIDEKRTNNGKTYHPDSTRTIRRRITIAGPQQNKPSIITPIDHTEIKKPSLWFNFNRRKNSSFRRQVKYTSPVHTTNLHTSHSNIDTDEQTQSIHSEIE